MFQRLSHQALGALVMLAVAASVGAGGRVVQWCPSMQQVMSRCCCDHVEAAVPEGLAGLESGCCERRVLPAVPAASARSEAPTVAAAVWVAVPARGDATSTDPLGAGAASDAARARERAAPCRPRSVLYVAHCALLL